LPEGCIKVLTYNVCTYGGNFKYHDAFERILDYFEAQQADIVCLQEDVDTWRRYSFIKYEKQYPYNDTTLFSKTKNSTNGVGIHTRYPIIRKERIAYESMANGSMAYFLDRGTDTLLVINNHLESSHLTKEDRSRYEDILRGGVKRDTMRAESINIISKLTEGATMRAPAAEAVRHYIDEHNQYPVIVCGDFNDTPISYARRTIAEGLTDCFAKSGYGIGLSYNRKGFWVRIDHILCSTDFTPYNCHVDSKIDYSDHFPIVCWLKMKDKP
jgi:endonuclease/exonuclease/phosphatase family metal-dependent hydrolase